MSVPDPSSERPPLSASRIEAAALTLIEREGTGFSMRRLAGELGASPMGLYHYFPSKGHLMDALVDRVFAPLMPLPAAGQPWRVRIEAAVFAWREAVLARPGLLVFLLTHRLNTPTALAWLDAVIGLFREVEPDPAAAARRFRVTGYYITGAVLDEGAGYTRGPSTVAPLTPEVMAATYPNVVAAAPSFAPEARERTFREGLVVMLDAVDPALRGGS